MITTLVNYIYSLVVCKGCFAWLRIRTKSDEKTKKKDTIQAAAIIL